MISPAASANACSASGYPALFTSAVKWLCCSRKPLNAPSRRKRNPFRSEPDQENIVRTKGRRHCRCAWCSLCPLRLCALRVEFLLPSRNRGAHLCACKSCRRNPLGIISFAYSRGVTLIDSHPYEKHRGKAGVAHPTDQFFYFASRCRIGFQADIGLIGEVEQNVHLQKNREGGTRSFWAARLTPRTGV